MSHGVRELQTRFATSLLRASRTLALTEAGRA